MGKRADSGKRESRVLDPGRPILLVGLMGAGKSAVGRLLAARLGRPFADTDRLIESEARATIAELWAAEGERAFRARERLWVERIPLVLRGHVVAIGGGMFASAENVAALSASTWSVWLRAPVATLLARLGPEAARRRPLLAGASDPASVLTTLLLARGPWYRRANLVIDTEGRELEAVVGDVERGVIELERAGATPHARDRR